MKFAISLLYAFFFLMNVCFAGDNLRLKKGEWIAELHLSKTDILPFNLTVTKQGRLIVKNANEEILLEPAVYKNDSCYVRFPYFNSELVYSVVSKKEIKGVWKNYNKGSNYQIPFNAKRTRQDRFNTNKNNNDTTVNGKWEVEFETGTSSPYPSLGVFKQEPSSPIVTGTFLTETGDYRFLEGAVKNDSLYLSCFDGSHAFLFKAVVDNKSLRGNFYSGNHWSCEWKAVRNESFLLKSPDELTFVKEEEHFSFSLKTLDNQPFTFPNEEYDNKVVIVQIMGTWCPNCLDETHYYKELFNEYHDKGLEIISIGYETGNDFNDYAENLKRLKAKMDLDFTFLVGGNAKKSLASEHFSMLNEVISFPTSIFVARDGSIKRVHTGFNGPGTGSYYAEYKMKTRALIETLLNQ